MCWKFGQLYPEPGTTIGLRTDEYFEWVYGYEGLRCLTSNG